MCAPESVSVCVCVSPPQMISPEGVKAVVGKGMPVRGNSFVKGDLFIQFDVKFPPKGSLSPDALAVSECLCVLCACMCGCGCVHVCVAVVVCVYVVVLVIVSV